MKTIAPSRLLKFALYTDAAGSTALAALQLAVPTLLAQELALPAVLLTETGIFLAAYALLLVYLARAPRLWSAVIQFIVAGNVGWALACLALTAAPLVTPSGLGVGFLLFQVAAVLMFAALEYAGLRASPRAPSAPGMQLN